MRSAKAGGRAIAGKWVLSGLGIFRFDCFSDTINIRAASGVCGTALNAIVSNDSDCSENTNDDDHNKEFDDREAGLFSDIHTAHDYIIISVEFIRRRRGCLDKCFITTFGYQFTLSDL